MKKLAYIVCFCLWQYSSFAQPYETGVILDSIPVSGVDNETFALYLPTAYDPNTLSPVLVVFSPSGHGKNALKFFTKAAEAYNYILVCSNNSRNGPYERSFPIAERLFSHVFENFNIGKERIYLAGFSGGSRLAASIAALTGQIRGVIACGAGFSSVPSFRPSTQDFSYAAICGNRDMNFIEMHNVREYLERLNFRNTLFTFDGNHRWPPNEQIMLAFEWLEMQAVKAGHLKKSEDEIKKGYHENMALAKKARHEQRPLLVAEHLDRITQTYGPHANVDSLRNALKDIKKSKAYISAVKARQKAFAKEIELSSKLFDRFAQDFDNPKKANLDWWDKELNKLDKVAKGGDEMNKMLERLQYNLFAAAYEKSRLDFSEADAEQKEFCSALITRMRAKLRKAKTAHKS